MSVATKLRAALDGVMDAIVLSLALWTLLYCLGLATQWSLWPSGWLWLAATVLLLGWRVAVELRTLGFETVASATSSTSGPAGDTTPGRLPLLYAGVALAMIGAFAGLFWSERAFPVAWAAACLAVALLTAWIWLRVRATGGDEVVGAAEPRPFDGGLWAHLGVLAISAGLAVGALFIHLEDSDDTYYVNRSVWVAEHGNAAIKDTMFGAEEFISPYGGGIPIASIEAQIGVVAHMLGIRAGTATYLIAGPVFSLLAGWAIWRLVRAWAPRRVFLVYAVAVGFLMLSGDSMMGNFWIVRMWQGKVMAICFLMPLIWAYVTELVEARGAAADKRRAGWWPIFMLLAAGTAFFGLTPTAVLWGPLMAGAILLAAILVRSRQLAVAAGALALGPVLSGIAVIVFSNDVGGEDPAEQTLSAYESFVRVLGETNPMVAVSLLGLAAAPLLVRFGTPALIAGCSALASVVVFAPGILPLANAVTGSGPILWRMLVCAPIPVLVGLLASAPAPAWLPRRRVVPILAGVALLAGLALGGRPIWSYTGHGGPVWVDTRPQWKLNVPARNDVALLVDEGLRGDVLLPPRQMKALTMYSTQAFPIVPRHWFIESIGEEQAKSDARKLLFRVAEGDNRKPSVPAVRRSLRLLDVDVACVGSGPDGPRILEVYKRAGYGDERRYGTLRCVTPQR